jgi:membrane fusion protein (multidrug efflux system)
MKTQYDVTKTNVEFMEANTLLKAPFNGVVTGKYFEDGELYSGTPTTTSGRSAVVTIMQINPLKVDVGITEQYYPLIRKGMKADITADVYPGEKFTGKVFRIAPTINPATRSFIAEIEVPNKNELLKPGMFVRVPASTVLLQEGTNVRYVFINENDIAKRTEVILGKRFNDQLEIISDNLKIGDKLVSEGQSRLLNNDRIEIVQ